MIFNIRDIVGVSSDEGNFVITGFFEEKALLYYEKGGMYALKNITELTMKRKSDCGAIRQETIREGFEVDEIQPENEARKVENKLS